MRLMEKKMEKNRQKTKAAFFDIDGTLFRSSLLVEQFKLLVKRRIIDPDIWFDQIKPLYDQYDKRYGEYDNYLLALTTQYQDKLKGIRKDFIQELSREVIDRNKDIVYRVTRNAIAEHKKNGFKIFFVSGSPDFLVDEFAKYYHADESIGTTYIFDENDRFTGKVVPMWDSSNKKKAIKYLIDKYNVDVTNSFAYGDTNGDFTMLKAVGNPVAVNPSYEFIERMSADSNMREKVKVFVERKDVRYSFMLSGNHFNFQKF